MFDWAAVCSRQPHPRDTGDDGRATIGQTSPQVGSNSCSRHCRLQRLLGAHEGRTVRGLKAHRAVILPLISAHCSCNTAASTCRFPANQAGRFTGLGKPCGSIHSLRSAI